MSKDIAKLFISGSKLVFARWFVAIALIAQTAFGGQENSPDIPAQMQPLLQELVNNNKELQAMAGRARALRIQAPAASALPDPVVGFGLVNVPIDSFSLDSEAMTQKQVFVAQKIPWLSSLSLEEQKAQLQALEAETRVLSLQLSLKSQLARTWYDLAFLSRRLALNYQLQEIVTQSMRVAESRYGTGIGGQQDILLAQVKLTDLLEEQSTLVSQEAALRAKLGGLLNRPDPFAETVTFSRGELSGESAVDVLIETALQHNPELQARQIALQQAQTDVSLAEKAYMPDFDLRLTYGQREDNPSTGEDRPDFLSATVALSVPIYQTRKQDNRLAAAKVRKEAAGQAIMAYHAILTNEIHRLVSELQGIRSSYELLQKPLLVQVDNLEDASLAAYSTGKLSFEVMLQARMRVLQTGLAIDRLQTEYSKKLAELHELTGETLTRPEVQQ
jgi:cobalt-zinc-cadmium efflux system outer membrane protein